ncbi:MAG: wax ester/triacylglycerol synthase family O-acyltransferase [Acidobacteriota bacterium]
MTYSDGFLSATDTSFLDLETDRQPLHIGSCLLYEGDLTAGAMIEALEASGCRRLLGQRLVEAPFRVSRPRLVTDPQFDWTRHVEEVTLAPALDRQGIGRAVGRAFQGRLPRSRPLWKVVLLRGLACGHTAVVWKMHHALVDGVSGVRLLGALHDASSEKPRRPSAPSGTTATTAADLLADGIEHQVGLASRVLTERTLDLMTPSKWRRERDRWQSLAAVAREARARRPEVPFNGSVSGRREYAAVELPLADFRQVRRALGGTLHDVVRTVVSGGLGAYLRGLGIDTHGPPLQSLCPVSLRRSSDRRLGNVVSSLIAPLHVGLEDPVERLQADKNALNILRRSGQARALHDVAEWSEALHPALQWAAGRLPRVGLVNTVCSHVPGPRSTLHLAGHRLRSWYPMGPLFADVGLFVAVLSYDRRLSIGLTVDRELVPDVWDLAAAGEASYTALFECARDAEANAPGFDATLASHPLAVFPQSAQEFVAVH